MNQTPSVGNRLVSMLLDHIIVTMAGMFVALPITFMNMGSMFTNSHEQPSLGIMSSSLYAFLIVMVLYLCKDCIRGRSLAKRSIRLQVVDNTTGLAASPIKCTIRNLFCFIWPLEVFVTLFSPSRRIGDFVAGTKVVNHDPQQEQTVLNKQQIAIAVLLSIGLSAAILIPLKNFFNKLTTPDFQYVESSYNEARSATIEQLYADSMGQYLSADVRLYDSINGSDLKYVSIVFNLNEDYLEDDGSARELKAITKELLNSEIPKDSITGYLKYIYSSNGTMRSQGLTISPTEK